MGSQEIQTRGRQEAGHRRITIIAVGIRGNFRKESNSEYLDLTLETSFWRSEGRSFEKQHGKTSTAIVRDIAASVEGLVK